MEGGNVRTLMYFFLFIYAQNNGNMEEKVLELFYCATISKSLF